MFGGGQWGGVGCVQQQQQLLLNTLKSKRWFFEGGREALDPASCVGSSSSLTGWQLCGPLHLHPDAWPDSPSLQGMWQQCTRLPS